MASNQYTVADKSTGDTWQAAEHNLLKAVHNLVAQQVCDLQTEVSSNDGDITAINTDLANLQQQINTNHPNPEW